MIFFVLFFIIKVQFDRAKNIVFKRVGVCKDFFVRSVFHHIENAEENRIAFDIGSFCDLKDHSFLFFEHCFPIYAKSMMEQ